MAFTDVEMSILAQLAYQDIPVDMSLYDVLEQNKNWLKSELGGSFDTHLENLIAKVDSKNYRVVATENSAPSGFAAYAFKTPDNDVVVAARGTQFSELNDVIADAELAMSVEAQQHRDMEAFVNDLEKYGYDGYYFTGHSLGGNVATHGAVCVSNPGRVKGVYAYNAPGFNEAYWIYNGWKLRQIDHIKNFKNEYDYVSSILRTPGETVVIDSAKDSWWHGDFGDHSICNYSINDDGTFNKNKTGLKSVQTVLGTALGAAGEAIARNGYLPQIIAYKLLGVNKTVFVTRDFSDESKERMLNLVSQVENEKWSDFTDWIGDRWYDFEDLIGKLDIRRHINDVNSYHKKVIDKNNATAKTIEKIFNDVHKVDATYAKNVENAATTLGELKRFVETMTQIVAPGKGNFTGHNITGSLDPILGDISKATLQQIVDSLMQEIDGQKVFDEEAILEYIKKDPGTMTNDEKQALLDVIEEMQDTGTYFDTRWTSSFLDELKQNYGVDDLLAGSGYIGEIYGFVNDIKSAESLYDYVDTGANIYSFLTNANKTWKNYKLIGNAVGVKTSTTWWLKNVTGIKPLGRSSTASTWFKRFGNNLTNKTSPFAAQLKDIGKNFTGANGVGKAVSSWASVAVTGVVNFLGNKQEQAEANGTMSDGRVAAETITETAIDTAITLGAGAVVGAAVAACTTVALPGVVVTAATGLVIAGVNAGVKALTGKTGTEWASDFILDTGEKVVNKIGNAAKSVNNAVSGWFKKINFA